MSAREAQSAHELELERGKAGGKKAALTILSVSKEGSGAIGVEVAGWRG